MFAKVFRGLTEPSLQRFLPLKNQLTNFIFHNRYMTGLKELYSEKNTFVKQLIDCEAIQKEATLKLTHKVKFLYFPSLP